MKIFLILVGIYFAGVMALLFYTRLHASPDDDVPYSLVLLLIVFWPIVLLLDLIINGTDMWEAFKQRFRHK